MNTCVLALARNNAPEPLQITTKVASVPGVTEAAGTGHRKLVSVVIAESNRTITPIRATIECDMAFNLLGATLGGEQWIMGSGARQISPEKGMENIDSPAWRPRTPLVFAIVTLDKAPGACKVSDQS